MLVFVPDLSREAFAEWLANQPENADAGTPGDCAFCPLSQWIRWQVKRAIPGLAESRFYVYVGPGSLVVRVDETEIHMLLPKWATEFVRKVDSDFRHCGRVKVREAISLLLS